MQLTFNHPRSTAIKKFEVDGHCTGKNAIDELVRLGFLDATTPDRPYTLTLTSNNNQVLPGQTLESAGVADGDTIAVGQDGKGARVS